MKQLPSKMVKSLSNEDQQIFTQLVEKLNRLDGDISKLKNSEMNLIKQLEAKYKSKCNQPNDNIKESNKQLNRSKKKNNSPTNLLETDFAIYSRQILARDLANSFPSEEDAVTFAFENKWIPKDFCDDEKTEQLFEDYQQDIGEANQWREEVVGIDSDKRMAVGLTWFMVIYQLHTL